MPRVRFVAVDAPFLIALAKGDPACETAVDVTRRLRLFIVVPPSAMMALYDIIDNDRNAHVKAAAQAAANGLATWGFHVDGLDDIHEIIADGAARLLDERTDLPMQACRVLAETSALKCTMFLTDDVELYKMPRQQLDILLMDRDLDSFLITDPVTLSMVAEEVLGSL